MTSGLSAVATGGASGLGWLWPRASCQGGMPRRDQPSFDGRAAGGGVVLAVTPLRVVVDCTARTGVL